MITKEDIEGWAVNEGPPGFISVMYPVRPVFHQSIEFDGGDTWYGITLTGKWFLKVPGEGRVVVHVDREGRFILAEVKSKRRPHVHLTTKEPQTLEELGAWITASARLALEPD